jgi:cyanophycin synthetase
MTEAIFSAPLMVISRLRALRGPNLWSSHTSIEAIVTCQPQAQDIRQLPEFETQLRQRFPQLLPLRPQGNEDVVSMAKVLELAALGLQAEAGCKVTFSHTVATVEAGVYQVIVEYSEEAVGRLAFEHAEALCLSALNGTAFDLTAALAQLRELDEDVRLGPSTGAIVQAAQARNIPYRRLTEGSLVMFGWGRKQRKIQAAETDGTSAIAEAIAQDKDLTKNLLSAAGVPVPIGQEAETAEQAWHIATQIGLPVVVKPKDGNQGKGVTVNIVSQDHLNKAFASAAKYGDVIVEKYLSGHDYRLLVIGDELVAAARRDPPHVIGDGVHTVRQLVDQVNSDPLRGDGHATSLTKIRFDDIAIARLAIQEMNPQSIPSQGQRVILRNNANLSTGGTATDVTDDVHPAVAARAVAAAQMIGLDICGVDLVCDTILEPIEQHNGGVVEVNAAPGLRMHLAPSYGKSRPVGEKIIGQMFPAGEDGRIPIIAVTGTNGKTTTVRLIAHLLATYNYQCIGMTNTDGVYIQTNIQTQHAAGMQIRQIDDGDCSGPKSARNVLAHPDVDAAVFETARGGILREGLAFDYCQVAVVTNIGQGDHLGLNYITTVQDLAVLKRVIVQNVAKTGMAVLNAADPIVAQMADHCAGQITFFARDVQHPIMATHRAQGRRVVYVEDDAIVATEGAISHRISLDKIPMTQGGQIGFQVDNAMAAIGAAWAVETPWAAIEAGLATFATDMQSVPGRFNIMTHRGATVIADYGHNPDAMQALVDAIAGIQPTTLSSASVGKRMVVISGAGDRRDEDIRQQTAILGAAFDEVILYQDQCQRGRADGEVLALLRQGLIGAHRVQHIEEIQGEFAAIDACLARLSAGDIALILVDQVNEALAYLKANIQP